DREHRRRRRAVADRLVGCTRGNPGDRLLLGGGARGCPRTRAPLRGPGRRGRGSLDAPRSLRWRLDDGRRGLWPRARGEL
ncbi:MAG: hypothetical protein AVDCRST_MAG53-2218, partial [uncultured Solirubrobacteraceae bacterium]